MAHDKLTGQTGLDAQGRSIRAQIASASRWAKPGARERQSIASQEALRRRHVALIDPDGTLAATDPDELHRCVENAVKADMARRALERAKKAATD